MMGDHLALASTNLAHRRKHNFANSKSQVLGKRDKSYAGSIDPRARAICALINNREEYYSTSSCSGRCFLYQGAGVKATTTFRRFRISHDLVLDSQRYFDLTTLRNDPTGGCDPIRSIGRTDHAEKVREFDNNDQAPNNGDDDGGRNESVENNDYNEGTATQEDGGGGDEVELLVTNESCWLRYEPFILHVACRSLQAASALMNAARPSFKNVGLTTWKDDSDFAKYLVAIWGDEGLEMPLSTPDGSKPFSSHHRWLADLCNERHQRNWEKIDRFVQAVRDMPARLDEEEGQHEAQDNEENQHGGAKATKIPKHFDVIGDVAVLNTLPDGDEEDLKVIGEAILKKNRAIKLVVARQSNLEGTERAPGSTGFVHLAGAIQRNPLMTSHAEYGIKCVLDLSRTFFSPRMGPERLRICQQVARGEDVLVLFAGVGMEALQIAGRTEAKSVVAVELNPIAVQCLRRSHQLLERNKAVKCVGAQNRLEIIEGDVLEVIPQRLRKNELLFDRVLAPRPKEGTMDGDLGTGDGGKDFLEVLLTVLKKDGGECHWYDFAADHEFPECRRTRELLGGVCESQNLNMEILHVANAGSVAMRQLRVCVDFRISPKLPSQ